MKAGNGVEETQSALEELTDCVSSAVGAEKVQEWEEEETELLAEGGESLECLYKLRASEGEASCIISSWTD